MPKPQKNSHAGCALIKAQRRERQNKNLSRSQRHALVNPEQIQGTLDSITDPGDVDKCMADRNEIIDDQYLVGDYKVKIVSDNVHHGILTDEEKNKISKTQQQHKSKLCIPRRPHWTEETTKEELISSEQNGFLAWQRSLRELSRTDNLTMTPYENNLEVWRQLWRVLERSDVVVQILDARNPLLFRCADVEDYVKELDPKKVNLLLVNKSDFLTEEQRQHWADYFNEEGVYAVFFSAKESSEALTSIVEKINLKTQQDDSDSSASSSDEEDEDLNTVTNNVKNCNISGKFQNIQKMDTKKRVEKYVNEIPSNSEESDSDTLSATSDVETKQIKETEKISKEIVSDFSKPEESEEKSASFVTSSKLYNREELIQLFSDICPAPKLLQEKSYIGMVGYPNVGKSSTINCLLQKKKVTVSATPGKTKHFQTLHLTSELVLCDCPGLVFPGFVTTRQEMHLWGILPIDRIRRDYVSPIKHLCHMLPPLYFQAAYSMPLPRLDRPPFPDELLSAYALMRGFMSARGRPDVGSAARRILKDFMNGALLHCVAPPSVDQGAFHTYDTEMRTEIQLTPQQILFMPETQEQREEFVNRFEGLSTVKTDGREGHGGTKPRPLRVKLAKTRMVELPDGTVVEVSQKPERTRKKKKINVNNHNPYGVDFI